MNKPVLKPIDLENRLPLRVVERPEQDAPSPSPPPRHARGWIWALLVALVAGLMVIAYLNLETIEDFIGWRPPESSTPAAAPVSREVLGLGKLRPEGNVIAIAAPFGAGDARIAEIKVAEGSAVRQGAIIAILDSAPSLQSAVETARANLEVQRAVVEQTKFASTASRDEAMASLESARAAAEVAKLDHDRTATLYRKGIAAKAAYDQKQSAYEQALRAVDRAQATLGRFDEQKIGGRQDVIVAERRVAAAEAEVRNAEQNLEKAFIRAPADGTILSFDNRVGEKPSQNGIASMADLSRMIAEIEVYQANIGAVTLGQKVTLTSEALKEPLSGTVSFIGLEVKRQDVVGADPAANTDARVVEVHAALDQRSTERARAFTNLQVTARIAVDPPQ